MPSLATDWRSNIPGWARRKRHCSSSTSCWNCILTTPAVTSWQHKLWPGRNETLKPKPCSKKESNQPSELAIATPRTRCRPCSTNCDLPSLSLSRIPAPFRDQRSALLVSVQKGGVRDHYNLPSRLRGLRKIG